VIIEGEKEWEVEKILNKRQVRGKDKYLVRWKGFTAESVRAQLDVCARMYSSL